MTPDQELAEKLAEARAFQAEATKGGNRQKSRHSARSRGRGGRNRGDSPSTPPVSHSSRGGRDGESRGGSLLQRATSRAAHQPAAFEQEQSESHLPATPSYTPQNVKLRPFAIPIVAPPSANSGLTPSASPSGSGSSTFAPQAAPNATASNCSSSHEESRRSAQRGLTLRRGRGSGRSRFARQKEEDAVFAFFNDDTPAPVGEVRYYQEEYEKKETSKLQKPNSSKLQENHPKQPEETSCAATSHFQDEPSTVNYKTENETNPKEEAKAQIRASDEVDVKVSDQLTLVNSQNVNAQESEHAALLREIKEGEAALAEMAKLIAIKKANAEKLKKAKTAKLHIDSACGNTPDVLQQVTNTGSSVDSPHQGASAAVIVTPSTATYGGGFNSQTQVPQTTGGIVPNTASNSTDDLMDLDLEPATMQYVLHPVQLSPLGLASGHFSFQNGFQEAEDEEEL